MLYVYAITGVFNESSVFEHLGLYFVALWALGMDVVSSFVFWGFTRSTEKQFYINTQYYLYIYVQAHTLSTY